MPPGSPFLTTIHPLLNAPAPSSFLTSYLTTLTSSLLPSKTYTTTIDTLPSTFSVNGAAEYITATAYVLQTPA